MDLHDDGPGKREANQIAGPTTVYVTSATDSDGSLKCRLTWRALNFVQDRPCSMSVPVRMLGVIKWRITIQLWKVGIHLLEYRNPADFCTCMTTNCISKWKGKETFCIWSVVWKFVTVWYIAHVSWDNHFLVHWCLTIVCVTCTDRKVLQLYFGLILIWPITLTVRQNPPLRFGPSKSRSVKIQSFKFWALKFSGPSNSRSCKFSHPVKLFLLATLACIFL